MLPSKTTLDAYLVSKCSVGVNSTRFDEVRRIARLCQRKQVALIWDEMIIQPNLSFDASGELYGYARNKAGVLANSVLCFLFSALG